MSTLENANGAVCGAFPDNAIGEVCVMMEKLDRYRAFNKRHLTH
jgi:hypothetical protein